MRKKPLWPFLGALGCLFALAVAAPSSWRRSRAISVPPASSAAGQGTVTPSAISWHGKGSKNEGSKKSAETVVKLKPEPDGDALVAEAPFENRAALPIQQEFDFDALLRIRDQVLGIVGGLPNHNQRTQVAAPRRSVQVASEQDRLAIREPRLALAELRDSVAPRLAVRPALAPQAPARLPQASSPQPPVFARQEIPQQPAEKPVERPTFAPPLRSRPTVLFEQLEALAVVPLASEWAEKVADQLRRLTMESSTVATDPLEVLDVLQRLAEEGSVLSQAESNPVTQQAWLQANWALKRRLGIWQVLWEPTHEETLPPNFPATPPDLRPLLEEIGALLAGDARGDAWSEYLLLDRLATAASEGAEIDGKKRGKLAYEVLTRMFDPRLTEAQEAFLSTRPLLDLHQQLQLWAAQPVDLNRLVALVERYESGRELRFAAAIAQIQQQLQWSRDPHWHALADHLREHYRGANMRIALAGELLNRMVPKQKVIVTPVSDRIAGAKVLGQARTTTNLKVQLVPDSSSWQMRLEASGKVYSQTRTDTWPARVRSAAKMQYQANKLIMINQEGLHISPTKAQAQGRNALIGVDSQLDPIPLVGSLLREIARKKSQKSRPVAMSQVKAKVARQARLRMDKEADAKFIRIEQKFRENILGSLEQLALIADPVAMQTTPERLAMQLRLANDGQLAAHTPRPLAPSDSLASVQMHETVLNNAMAGLELDGQRMKLVELFHFFAKKLGYVDPVPPEDLPMRTVLEFAARDAILIRCDGDCLQVILSIRELAHGRDKIRNFRVHVRFRPVLEGLDVRLVREGSLEFSGRRLKTGPRVVLHSVLGKLFAKDQEVRLLAGNLQGDPRLAGLMVTQLVIEDGWIALALGPIQAERNAWRSHARREASAPLVR